MDRALTVGVRGPTPVARLLAQAMLAIALLYTPGAPAWTDAERAVLRSLSLASLTPPPPSPSNRHADSAAAARFGERLFFEPRLSASGTVACSHCHRPEQFFTDGRERGEGLGTLARNTPTVVGPAWFDWLYWDGRRDSLWSQALTPLEAPEEMGLTRVDVLRVVDGDPRLRKAYRLVFGPLPPLPDASAGPYGSDAARRRWLALDDAKQRALDSAFANVGKALAAWQRTLRPPRTRFDAYVDAVLARRDATAATLFDDRERAGLEAFMDDARGRCLRCHSGPLFSNGEFHNIGTGNFSPGHLDFGRALGARAVRLDPFNCLGEHSDAAPHECAALRFMRNDHHDDEMTGAYRTPGLRGVAGTAPYFHDGSRATLAEVVAHYAAPPPEAHELVGMQLAPEDIESIEAFLRTLSPP